MVSRRSPSQTKNGVREENKGLEVTREVCELRKDAHTIYSLTSDMTTCSSLRYVLGFCSDVRIYLFPRALCPASSSRHYHSKLQDVATSTKLPS